MDSFFPSKHLIIATHIAGVHDVNRNEILQRNNDDTIIKWIKSIDNLGMHGILFHNHFEKNILEKYRGCPITFIKVDYNPNFNPNVFRYLIYRDFLIQNKECIEHVFFTDVSDVEVLSNPFESSFYMNHSKSIFCGDEPKILDNDWMYAHSTELRKRIQDYEAYEEKFKKSTLLNCGIFGGNISLMVDFVTKLAIIHELYNHSYHSEYTGDMGAFNYLVRTQFNDVILHGCPINTQFKLYEQNRQDCWFKHK